MNYERFKEKVAVLVKQAFDGEVHVKIHTIPKNNGLTKDGLTIIREDENMSPTIYLEKYFEMYEEGIPLSVLMEGILQEYEKGGIPNLETDFFTDFQKAKANICYKLINYEKNTELLKDIPHLEILDLSIVFYYKVKEEISEGATILIHEKHRENWGISLEELYQLAKTNTAEKLSPIFQSIHQVICDIVQEEDMDICASHPEKVGEGSDEMYVLTNEEKYLGAGCFLYTGTLKKIADRLQSDFFILPSSIHECIIMPDSGLHTSSQLNELVRDMNENYLAQEEVLSDLVYHYDRESGMLEIQ